MLAVRCFLAEAPQPLLTSIRCRLGMSTVSTPWDKENCIPLVSLDKEKKSKNVAHRLCANRGIRVICRQYRSFANYSHSLSTVSSTPLEEELYPRSPDPAFAIVFSSIWPVSEPTFLRADLGSVSVLADLTGAIADSVLRPSHGTPVKDPSGKPETRNTTRSISEVGDLL